MEPLLLVASLLPGDGPSGVETHAHAVVERARAAGLTARFVSGQRDKDWRRRLRGLQRRLLLRIDPERALLLETAANAAQLGRTLRRAIAEAGNAPVTVYAQDPSSARAALRLRDGAGTASSGQLDGVGKRPGRSLRVVMTVHFNVSEAQELADRGLTRPGAPLWNDAVRTEQAVLAHVDHLIFVSAFMRDAVFAREPALARRSSSLIPNFCQRPRSIADLGGKGAATIAGTSGRADASASAARKEDTGTGFGTDAPALTARGDLLAIGTLEPRKNQRFLLDVLAACRRRGRVYGCTLVGHGPDAGALQAHAQAVGVAGQVRFLGHLPAAAALIPNHRVLVHGARMENMPITLIEALACGRPVMAAAVGGIPEIVTHGQQGFLWPLDDVERAASLLVDLFETPGLWERMSANALRCYEERFSAEVLGPRWLAAILGEAAAEAPCADAGDTPCGGTGEKTGEAHGAGEPRGSSERGGALAPVA